MDSGDSLLTALDVIVTYTVNGVSTSNTPAATDNFKYDNTNAPKIVSLSLSSASPV